MAQVSIILPVYNGEAHLKQAINSVLLQSYSDWELIVIDDGSTDTTASIIQSYVSKDSRVRQIIHEKNLGLVTSLNEGVAVSAGSFLARLDCDDYWPSPDKLNKQMEFLGQHPRCGLVGTWAEMLDMQGKRLYDFKPPANDVAIRKQILWHNCFVHSGIIIRKNILRQAGGYKLEDLHVEDYALWLRAGKISALANLPEVLVKYRKNPAGVTKTKNREQVAAALGLIRQFKDYYPGHWLGWLKWRLQLWGKSLPV
jgi:glycosyltransferase involved in cell wall biosynthesis